MMEYWELCEKYIREKVILYPNILNMLSFLKREKVGIGIVTNSEQNYVKILIKYFLKINFDIIASARSTEFHKPSPEPIFFAIKCYKGKFHLNDIKTIYIGNSISDIQAGKNANILTGLAAWALTAGEIDKFALIKPDYIFYDPIEVIKLVKES